MIFLSLTDVLLLSISKSNIEYYIRNISEYEFNRIKKNNYNMKCKIRNIYNMYKLSYYENNDLFINGYFIVEKLFFPKLRKCVDGMTIRVDGNITSTTISYERHKITKYLILENKCEIHNLIFNCKHFAHLKEQNRLKQLFVKYRNLIGAIFVNLVTQVIFYHLSLYFKEYFIIKCLFQICVSHLFLILKIIDRIDTDNMTINIYFAKFFEKYIKYKYKILTIITLLLDLLIMYILFYSPFIQQ